MRRPFSRHLASPDHGRVALHPIDRAGCSDRALGEVEGRFIAARWHSDTTRRKFQMYRFGRTATVFASLLPVARSPLLQSSRRVSGRLQGDRRRRRRKGIVSTDHRRQAHHPAHQGFRGPHSGVKGSNTPTSIRPRSTTALSASAANATSADAVELVDGPADEAQGGPRRSTNRRASALRVGDFRTPFTRRPSADRDRLQQASSPEDVPKTRRLHQAPSTPRLEVPEEGHHLRRRESRVWVSCWSTRM